MCVGKEGPPLTTLHERMLPNWLNVSYSDLLSIDSCKFLINTYKQKRNHEETVLSSTPTGDCFFTLQ